MLFFFCFGKDEDYVPEKPYRSSGRTGNVCHQPRDPDSCSKTYAMSPAWYYDAHAKTCRVYWRKHDKNCQRSKNYFATRQACVDRCGGYQRHDSYYDEVKKLYGVINPSACLEPRRGGNGRESYLSWYFDQ
jgi:hypothetical protein